ncbi:hypothetical protein A5886_002554, partial [Enterococcus sp. 8G7_MSG3316]
MSKDEHQDHKDDDKRQRRIVGAGALLTVGAGAFMAGGLQNNAQAETTDGLTLSEKRVQEDEIIKDIEHTSVDELSQSLAKGESTSLATPTGHIAKMVDELPNEDQLRSIYGGYAVLVSDEQTTYSIDSIMSITDADVYYRTEGLSQSEPRVMKMTRYRDLIKANPNIRVLQTETYKTVSPHLYGDKSDAYMDSANWKDSRVVSSNRTKSIAFQQKDAAQPMNFTAADGTFIGNLAIDSNLGLAVKTADLHAPLTDEIKSDFADTMEKNFGITFNGVLYSAIFHDESVSTDYQQNKADGFFTFARTTHGLPLKVSDHYVVAAVNYGDTIESLQHALNLQAVKSIDQSNTWITSEETDLPVQVTATDSIADENEESFEIQALEQIIESLKYVYQTVSESVSDVFDTETAYASEVSSEPVVYSGSQAGISPGGAVDGSLSEDASGVASWNQTATFSGGGYGGHTITVNSAVTTKSDQVNATNFNAVLQSLHLQVDGQSYTSFVATPLVINGVNYVGYLSSSSGSGSDFTIAIKDTNFNVYQMGGNFAYISSPMSTGEATVDNETDETTPSEDGSTETPTATGEDTTTPNEDGSTETPTDTGEDTTTPSEDGSTENPTETGEDTTTPSEDG